MENTDAENKKLNKTILFSILFLIGLALGFVLGNFVFNEEYYRGLAEGFTCAVYFQQEQEIIIDESRVELCDNLIELWEKHLSEMYGGA